MRTSRPKRKMLQIQWLCSSLGLQPNWTFHKFNECSERTTPTYMQIANLIIENRRLNCTWFLKVSAIFLFFFALLVFRVFFAYLSLIYTMRFMVKKSMQSNGKMVHTLNWNCRRKAKNIVRHQSHTRFVFFSYKFNIERIIYLKHTFSPKRPLVTIK